MRESMTLLEQSNVFSKSNHQRAQFDRIPQHPRVYSTTHGIDDHDVELKALSFDVYTNKHLITTGKAILPYPERSRLDEIILPAIEKNTTREEVPHRRRRKRPSYRRSLFHPNTPSNATPVDGIQVTARGMKPDYQITIPTSSEEDMNNNYRSHYAPPPSPSDDQLERLIYELQDMNQTRSQSQQSIIEKEGYIPFRLPALGRPNRYRQRAKHIPPKDIRSTLSNYLQRYY